MVETKCNKCAYKWNYEGKAIYYLSCPRCRKVMKVPVNHNE